MMKNDENLAYVQEIMLDYARITGLALADAHPKRYLWTDAFAVCNYLELFQRTGDEFWQALALQLVDQVHNTLGRHREDDPRTGWISGLAEQDGKLHPTRRGLRIGKPMNERRPSDLPNERLEWDRDGQYFHYLTKWMHALNSVSRITGDPKYTMWAAELARAAHDGFTYTPSSGGQKRMYWKMSIDLSRPLVSSMGQHDPLDGFLTYSELEIAATMDHGRSLRTGLSTEMAEMADICRGTRIITEDPLGTGGLLSDASRIAQLMVKGNFRYAGLLETVMDAALQGVMAFAECETLRLPAEHRLAFRELGLSIGMKGAGNLLAWIRGYPTLFGGKRLQQQAEDLMRYTNVGVEIERFWLDDRNRACDTWIEHREINMVMLATSLAPDGFLTI
jgi:hypothetical protein